MIKKITFTLILITSALYAVAADRDSGIYIEPKLNVASACVGILNPAIEIGFGKSSAVEYSSVTSFAKEDFLGTGYPLLINMIMVEYRNYFFSDKHKGFFAGADLGWNEFKIHKHLIPFIAHDQAGRSYDWGVGVFLGITLGYKFALTEQLFLELSASGGWQHTWHEPYVDGQLSIPMNASGEWTPYKAGLYLSYRFGKWHK